MVAEDLQACHCTRPVFEDEHSRVFAPVDLFVAPNAAQGLVKVAAVEARGTVGHKQGTVVQVLELFLLLQKVVVVQAVHQLLLCQFLEEWLQK